MGDDVQFTDEQWEAVALAAEAFADVLTGAQASLSEVLDSNWAGECAEGKATIENLRSLLRGDAGSFSQTITSESDYLKSVAAQCRASKATLRTVDEAISGQFRK